MEQFTHLCVQWTILLVPALVRLGHDCISVYRTAASRALVDSLYFLVMLAIAALTWRTMNNNDAAG